MFQGKYISADDLARRLTAKTFLAIYDDENTGDIHQVDDLTVGQDIEGGEGEVDSYLVLINLLPLPVLAQNKIDRLIKTAALDYSESLAFLRHPDYPRTFGENGKSKGLWATAEKRMERLKKSLQQLPDITVQTGHIPSNTGGFVQSGNVDNGDLVEIDEDDPIFKNTGLF